MADAARVAITNSECGFQSLLISLLPRVPQSERRARYPFEPPCALVGIKKGKEQGNGLRRHEVGDSLTADKKLNLRRFNGALGGNRTHDPLLRRQLLYPTELRALTSARRR